MARALCAADGHDPEGVMHLGMDDGEAGGEGFTRDVLVPAWTAYDGEARRFIAAARALEVVE